MPKKWPRLLDKTTRYFDARGAQVGNTDLVNSRLSFSLVHGYDWSAEHMLRYESLMSEDPRLKHFSANPCKPVHCRMSLTDEELRSSRVYKEVLAVGGAEYSLGVNFVEHERTLSYFLVLRDATMPPFSQQDCDKMAVLIPHLARALRLQRELDTINFEKQVGFSALDNMVLGVFIADENGRIQFTNALARRLLDRRDGLSVDGAVLHGTVKDNSSLAQHIRAAARGSGVGAEGNGRALKVKRPGGADPYLVVVSSTAAPTNPLSWKGHADNLAVLFVRDPDHGRGNPHRTAAAAVWAERQRSAPDRPDRDGHAVEEGRRRARHHRGHGSAVPDARLRQDRRARSAGPGAQGDEPAAEHQPG